MIDHIVLVKFSEATTEEQIQEAARRFKALRPHLTGIVDMQAGINVAEKSKKEYQLVLSVRFDSLAALEAYNPHPEHQAVAAYIREIGRVDSIVVDIEV